MSTQKQLSFEIAGGAPSQAQIIAEYLKARPFTWVSLTQLYEVSGAMAVATRVSNLNAPFKALGQRGPFENQTDTSVRPHLSWYRYAPTSE